MASYNSLTIVGHVGRDPEMRYTPSGKAVTSFSVAVNRNRKDTTEVDWFEVSCWERLAEAVNTALAKGALVMVVGPVEVNTYMTKSGETRSQLRVTAREIQFLSRKTEGGTQTRETNSEPPGMPF